MIMQWPGLVLEKTGFLHETPIGHPESIHRLKSIQEILIDSKIMFHCVPIDSRLAAKEELALCHTLDYIELVEQECAACEGRKRPFELSTGDVSIGLKSFEAACYAAGAVLNAVDAVMGKKCHSAFCAVRPPGHHATANRGMGFCLFNNVAIGARYAIHRYGFSRILIVDWDVHHGNGTQEIFEQDPQVFYFSTHQWGIYPGTGASTEKGKGKGLGYTMNCPIVGGDDSKEEVFKAFYEKLIPAMERYQPECIFLSAGFDAHYLDPKGNFQLTERDFADLTRLVCSIAQKWSQKRVISVLEGGYHVQALALSVAHHIKALAEG